MTDKVVMGSAISVSSSAGAGASGGFASDERYYDSDVSRRVRDHTKGNPRITAALERFVGAVETVAPSGPARVLEIGCGIGFVSAALARRWSSSLVVGCDLSRRAIDEGRRLFGTVSNLELVSGRFEQQPDVAGGVDALLLMDVYEHVPVSGRAEFHTALSSVIADVGCAVVTVPTPRHQAWLRETDPSGLQPVDEDVHPSDLVVLASDLGADLVTYDEISIWHRRDYAHAVLRWGDHPFSPVARPSDGGVIRRFRASAAARLVTTRWSPRRR